MVYVDAPNGVVREYGIQNPQCAYGADVAARIQAASDETGLKELQSIVLDAIYDGCYHLLMQNESSVMNTVNAGGLKVLSEEYLKDGSDSGNDSNQKIDIPIYVSGNTTMLHILCGHSPKSIGAYPFTPEHPEAQMILPQDKYNENEIKADSNQTIQYEPFLNGKFQELRSLPCASGYIGADVLVGAYYYQLHKQDEINLFIDLGTNGEMMLGNKNRLLATSVAAGPAFERVLRGAEGLKALHHLYRTKQMDETGLLLEKGRRADQTTEIIKDTNGADGTEVAAVSEIIIGNTTITQTMVRELQLAKGAVRAGIELLCEAYGCALSDIHTVYVAGGLGFYMDDKDAIALGMFPVEFEHNIKVVGNSSLIGCAMCHNKMDELTSLAGRIETMNLAMNEKFNERYIQYMNF